MKQKPTSIFSKLPFKWKLWIVINPLTVGIGLLVGLQDIKSVVDWFKIYSIFWLLGFPILILILERKLEKRKMRRLGEFKYKLLQVINNFKPFTNYSNEQSYQVDLARYLHNLFPNTHIEGERGTTRPDIVIDDIAIEIKGPTSHNDLQSVADKCMRYPQYFSGGLIIVLFNVQVNDNFYSNWLRGITNTFPSVEVVRK